MAEGAPPGDNDVNDINQRMQNLYIEPGYFKWKVAEHLCEQILDICRYLDIEGAIMKNWRHLGAHFEVESIELDMMELEYKSSRSPSRMLFKHLSAKTPDMTFKMLLEALVIIERNDVKEKITKFMEQKMTKKNIQHSDAVSRISSGGSSVVDARPGLVTQSHCRELSKHLGSNWTRFLRECYLNVKIDEIEEESTELREKCFQALMCWKDCKNNRGSVDELKNLFEKIGRRDMADNFQRYTSTNTEPVHMWSDGPVTEYMIHQLTEDIGVDWKWVLRYLNMEEQVIKNIDKQYKKLEDKVFNGIKKWSDKYGKEATKIKLATAFRNADKGNLVEKLQNINE